MGRNVGFDVTVGMTVVGFKTLIDRSKSAYAPGKRGKLISMGGKFAMVVRSNIKIASAQRALLRFWNER